MTTKAELTNSQTAKAIRSKLAKYLMLIDDKEVYSADFMTKRGVATHELTKFVQWLERNGDAAECDGNCAACSCESAGDKLDRWLS